MNTSPFSVSEFTSAIEQSVAATFMEFNNATTHNPDALFVFYEGVDNDYYYYRIKQCTTRNIEPINCKNKKKVINVYQLIVSKPEYNRYHKGFFVDKDFDLNEEPFFADFYVTNAYSIENYYVSDACMENFLIQKYYFHRGDVLLESLMSDFRQMRQKYFDAIELFNTWYCAIKRKYGNTIRDINLGCTMPTNFIIWDFDAKDVQKHYSFESIETMFNVTPYPVTAEELLNAETYLRTNLQNNLRGKYCIGFMLRYLNDLKGFIKNTPAYSSHHRSLTISRDNIMSILSDYADTEQGLIDYIIRVAA